MVGASISKQVSDALDGSALDAAVRALFDVSWGRARDLVRRGKVTVDGFTTTDPTRPVRKGASIVLDLAARKLVADDALDPRALVHVDAHVVVVNKPSGVDTVTFDPDGMGASIARRPAPSGPASLDARVRALLARRSSGPVALGVVHRIDRETSGLVVFTRTWLAKQALSQAFRLHTVHRRYLALVHGAAESKTLRSNLVPDRGDGLRGSVEHRRGRTRALAGEKAQLAVTHVEVLERLSTEAGPVTLLACRLETGRTHQIRIHLSEAGHPLLGERVYVRGFAGPIVVAPRVMLHAAELGFVHPKTQNDVRWAAPLPEDFETLLARLRRGR